MIGNRIGCIVVLLLAALATAHGQNNIDNDAAARARDVLTSLDRTNNLPVFGTQLFVGASVSTRANTDPSYVLQRGDRIAVRSFGAYNADLVEEIDQNGMLFVPQVGPVDLAGRRASELQPLLEQAVRQTFTENVRVYASLLSAGSIGIYVSGDVNRPGRYLGSSTDDVLYYLQSAGGINPVRGSFRQISVLRGEEVAASFDLYQFLLSGVSPNFDFRDGDVIFVKPRGPLVGAEGEVLARYSYELLASGDKGDQLTMVARPNVSATHVSVRGFRDGQPFTKYLPLTEFMDFELEDGDRTEFRGDVFADTISVAVETSARGAQALYVLKRGSQLTDLLAQTELGAGEVDVDSIHVKRPAVAQQQKEALLRSLDRLERAATVGGSFSAEAAQVQRAEAELISSFIQRAREAEPSGIITVMERGSLLNLDLQDGDTIVIPSNTDVVLVSGEVVAPGAFVARDRSTLSDYVALAGGYQDLANTRKFVVLKRSGAAVEVSKSYRPEPGDQIMVLPRASNRGLLLATEITQVIFQLALSTATVARL